FSGVPQEGCQNLGRCDIGCPIHAKNTIDITYLARAEAHGAEVRPLHLAHAISPPGDAGDSWRVAFKHLGDGDDGHVQAPTVVLDIARGVNVIRGWRRALLRLQAALIHFGWSDQVVRPYHVKPGPQRDDTDSLIFLIIGRDAADGRMRLTPLLRRFDIRWSRD